MEEINPAWGMGVVWRDDSWVVAAASQAGEYPLQTRCTEQQVEESLKRLPPRRRVMAISAAATSLRRITLPFKGLEQVRAVLPQELADSELSRLQSPCFGVHWVPEENQSRVLFAAAETEVVSEPLWRARDAGLEPGAIVIEELASWPLLVRKQLMAADGAFLVIDCSSSPVAVYAVRGMELLSLRLAFASEGELLAKELDWLLQDLRGEFEAQGGLAMLGLGDVPEPVRQQYPDLRCPSLIDVGVREWGWLRAAGLAEAALSQEWPARLMNFRWGGLGYQSPVKQWVKPWRWSMGVAALLLLVAGAAWGLKYSQLSALEQQLQGEIRERFSELAPGEPMVDPVLQVQRLLAGGSSAVGGGQSFLAWVRSLQLSIEHQEGLVIDQLRYDAEGVQLVGELPSYAHLDKLQQTLGELPAVAKVTLVDAKKQADSPQIQFRIRLEE